MVKAERYAPMIASLNKRENDFADFFLFAGFCLLALSQRLAEWLTIREIQTAHI
jgi:hypothetical protein